MRFFSLLLMAFVLTGCAQPEATAPVLKTPRSIVDLSPTVGEDFPVAALVY